MRPHAARPRLTGSRPARVSRLAPLLVLLLAPVTCVAGNRGPFGIDYLLTYDNSGIWKRGYQEALEYGLIAFEAGGALWEGGDTRFGRTLWQSIDASVASGLVSQAMKYTFSRVRPIDSGPGGDPNLWFKGHGNQSFPSGEVTLVSSIVTPIMLEYGPQHPAVYALELLPLYDAVGRMKLQAHWQSDVLIGFALGTGMAWAIHSSPKSPFILQVMPHGIYVGIGKRF